MTLEEYRERFRALVIEQVETVEEAESLRSAQTVGEMIDVLASLAAESIQSNSDSCTSYHLDSQC